MPTPACLATAVIGAPGSATNTARAESRIRWSLRAASAWRPLIGPLRPAPCRPALDPVGPLAPVLAFVSVMKESVAGDWNKSFRSVRLGTEGFVPLTGLAARQLDNRRFLRCHQHQKPRT